MVIGDLGGEEGGLCMSKYFDSCFDNLKAALLYKAFPESTFFLHTFCVE